MNGEHEIILEDSNPKFVSTQMDNGNIKLWFPLIPTNFEPRTFQI